MYFKCDKCKQKHPTRLVHSFKGVNYTGLVFNLNFCPACFTQEMEALMSRCMMQVYTK